jgi:thioredoxin 1
MASDLVHEFTDDNFESEVIGSPVPVVVDLWAPWCGPCKMQGPIIDDLAKEYQGRVKFGKLNVDDNPATASKYGITSIPTLFFVKNGEIAGTQVGLMAKAPLKTKIDAIL